MSDQNPDQSLHLPSLVIKNFRGIDELTIPRLGRVTLLAGKNGVGKTTVLDAVRIYASRAGARILSEVLIERDEFVSALDADGTEIDTPDWQSLFHGYWNRESQPISAGTTDDPNRLQIRATPLGANEVSQLVQMHSNEWINDPIYGLRVTFLGSDYVMPASYAEYAGSPRGRQRIRPTATRLNEGHRPPADAVCIKLGPNVPENAMVERFLNDVLLTIDEQHALDALNLVSEETVDRVAVLGSGSRRENSTNRRVMARTQGGKSPFPLRSLGDGAVRTYVAALALASSKDGFLLIDEAENGIHHSIQAKFWSMVLQTAERNNVQVIATTHSWDCVVGFAKAANELEDVEGVLYRIQHNGERLRAVEYPETELANAAKHRIEVR